MTDKCRYCGGTGFEEDEGVKEKCPFCDDNGDALDLSLEQDIAAAITDAIRKHGYFYDSGMSAGLNKGSASAANGGGVMPHARILVASKNNRGYRRPFPQVYFKHWSGCRRRKCGLKAGLSHLQSVNLSRGSASHIQSYLYDSAQNPTWEE